MIEKLQYVNWIDILILIIIVRGLILGVRHGLTPEIFTFISVVLALVIPVYAYNQIADIVILNFNVPIWLAQFLSFMFLTLLVRIFLRPVTQALIKVVNAKMMPQLEFLGGLILGFGRGVIIAATIIILLVLTDSDYLKENIYKKSYSGFFLITVAQRVYSSVTFWLPGSQEVKEIFISSLPGSEA